VWYIASGSRLATGFADRLTPRLRSTHGPVAEVHYNEMMQGRLRDPLLRAGYESS
jgi:hypothetical protein